MRITASGGTDGASIALWWPDNLPNDADLRLKDDPIALTEELRNSGKLIWFLCEGDGGYTVAIYLRTELPSELRAVCTDEERHPTLIVRGDGYFGGMEYMFKHDSSFWKKYPGMCERVVIPDGTYSATVFRTKIPDGLAASWLNEHAGAFARRVADIHHLFAACAVVGVLASLISFFVLSWIVWSYVVGVAVSFIMAAVLLSRTSVYKAVAAAKVEFAKAYPSYVVHLE